MRERVRFAPGKRRLAGTLALAGAALYLAPAAWSRTRVIAGTTCAARVAGEIAPAGRWSGGCRGGQASGHGAVRVRVAGRHGVFAGRAEHGMPLSGITVLDNGDFYPLAPERETADRTADPAALASERAFDDAFRGAGRASAAYRAAGNMASAAFYAGLERRLRRGQPE